MDFGPPFISLKANELIATGLPSLDSAIGGGFHKGSIVLLNEDFLGIYSDLFLKTYLAQGIVNQDYILFATCDVSPNLFMSKLPQKAGNNTVPFKATSNEPLKIAWRYENYPLLTTNDISTPCSGFHFKDTLSESIISSSNVYCWPSTDPLRSYDDLIEFIQEVINTNGLWNEQSLNKADKRILRIGIHHLGSLFWKQTQNRLPYFLFRLRAIVHHSQAVAYITFPNHLIKESEIISRCEQMSDLVMELESFGANTNSLYSELNGFIRFKKLCALNSLCPLVKDSKDWAFKLSLQKLVVEKLRLPPESESSEQREQDVSNHNCYSMSNSKLDF